MSVSSPYERLIELRRQQKDDVVWFAKYVRPYLYVAFSIWLDEVYRANPSLRSLVNERQEYYAGMLKIFSASLQLAGFVWDEPTDKTPRIIFRHDGEYLTEWDELPNLDRVNLVMPEVEWTETVFLNTYRLWVMEVLMVKPWFKGEDKEAFFLRLTEAPELTHSFPKEIRIGNAWKLMLRFEMFLLPDRLSQTGVKELYDEIAYQYDQFAQENLKAPVMNKLFELLPEQKGKILDVASGTGYAKRTHPDEDLVGVDVSRHMSLLAKNSSELVVQGSARTLPYSEDAFDNAIISFAIHYLDAPSDEKIGGKIVHFDSDENMQRLFREIARVVKSGGYLVFNLHKPDQNWQDRYGQLLVASGFFNPMIFEQDLTRADGKPEKAYYLRAKVI